MAQGLYRLDEFRDNCGFGLIAHINGEASHKLLATGIEALTCMTHRGGINADGKTGDGCGLLIQKPDAFLRAEARALFSRDLPDQYAVGSAMLSLDDSQREAARTVVEEEARALQLAVVGWRVVPTDDGILGEIALRSLPAFEQVFIVPDTELNDKEFDARLFVTRRRVEQRLDTDPAFYFASLSARVLCYKGLMMPADITRFYPDLCDPRMETAICVFHQRFSTNTMPLWQLAQPFRMLAHNGEINTIVGNRNWALARTPKLRSPLLPDLADLGPLVNRKGSDSSSLDNLLELMVIGGIPLHRAIRIMVPPAWHNLQDIDPEQRAFFEYHSLMMEPWDGPAGLVITDGRYAVCALDRNGLRPSRWVLTDDNIITVASEIGVYGYLPENVIAKGRLGPGDMLSIDVQEGRIETRADIDRRLAASQPYKKWLRDGAFKIQSTMETDSIEVEGTLSPDQLKIYMKMFQVSFEERDQAIRPLAEGGQEAVGSMGDDLPMAVLSRRHRNLFDYFRQEFAQVTNPPIDPLREAIAMSLSTQLGPELNLFEETPQHAVYIDLTSPVLSPHKYFALKNNDHPAFVARKFSLIYDPQTTDLKTAIEQVCDEVEQAVRNDGMVLCILSDYDLEPGLIPIPMVLAV